MTKNQIYLEGQTALVTGASSGIGKATAMELGQAKANVAVNYVGNSTGADEAADIIIKNGGRAITVKGDVSKQDQVKSMFAATIKEFGTLDILGITKGCSFFRHDFRRLEFCTCCKFNRTIFVRTRSRKRI
jgi:NAD(P)-dependent dehydrogenase (short-subunit alcohol dehydrogenase family)